MDRQSMQQLGGGGGASSSAAKQDWLYPGAAGAGGQPAQLVDGTFLMELLEDDAHATEQEQPLEDVDRLSRVIQSLEAEIDGRLPPANAGSKADQCDFDDGGLLDNDMLSSDLDSNPGPCVAEGLPPFEYWPSDVPPAVAVDMGGWYLDDDGVMAGGYEFIREHCYYGYGDGLAVDQVYSPLWE